MRFFEIKDNAYGKRDRPIKELLRSSSQLTGYVIEMTPPVFARNEAICAVAVERNCYYLATHHVLFFQSRTKHKPQIASRSSQRRLGPQSPLSRDFCGELFLLFRKTFLERMNFPFLLECS